MAVQTTADPSTTEAPLATTTAAPLPSTNLLSRNLFPTTILRGAEAVALAHQRELTSTPQAPSEPSAPQAEQVQPEGDLLEAEMTPTGADLQAKAAAPPASEPPEQPTPSFNRAQSIARSEQTSSGSLSPQPQASSQQHLDASITGQKVGTWQVKIGGQPGDRYQALRTFDIIGGSPLIPADANSDPLSFRTIDAAGAHAHVMIASHSAEGGMIVLGAEGRYHLYSITIPQGVTFSHRQVKNDSHSLEPDNSAIDGQIQAFVTQDGYIVDLEITTVEQDDAYGLRLFVDAGQEQDYPEGVGHIGLASAAGYEQVINHLPELEQSGAINQQGYLALFIGLLKTKALQKLDENQALVESLHEQYAGDAQPTQMARLRQILAKNVELAEKEEQLVVLDEDLRATTDYLTPEERERPEVAEILQQQTEVSTQLEQIRQVRALLLKTYPEAALLNYGSTTSAREYRGDSDEQMHQILQTRIAQVLEAIEQVRLSIHQDEMPLSEMEPVVNEALQALPAGTEAEATALKFLADQQTQQIWIDLGGFLTEVGLTVGAFFTSGLTALVLAGLGIAVGAGNAAYNFERAEDLNAAATAGHAGNPLVDDPDEARFNYIMGWVNLVLAGIDVAQAAHEGSMLLRGAHALNPADLSVMAQLTPDQISRLDRVVQLEAEGDVTAAEDILSSLRRELSDEQIDQAKAVLRQSPEEARGGASTRPTVVREQDYLVEDELARRRGRVVQVAGEDLVARAEANLRRLFDEANLYIAIPEESLENVLREGRYRTVHELRKHPSDYFDEASTIANQDQRRRSEEFLFGYPQNLPAEYRPVSGYLASRVDAEEAPYAIGYSPERVAVRLSENVRNRTTFTGDDSLSNTLGRMFEVGDSGVFRQPSNLNDPNISSFLSMQDIENLNPLSLADAVERIASADTLLELHQLKIDLGYQYSSYIEVQIHGQVTVNDIAEIIYLQSSPSDEIVTLSGANGIPIRNE